MLCLVVKRYAVFLWKDAISWVHVSPGSAETLVRWGGNNNNNYYLIGYVLLNISAKKIRNRVTYVEVVVPFLWNTVCVLRCLFIQFVIFAKFCLRRKDAWFLGFMFRFLRISLSEVILLFHRLPSDAVKCQVQRVLECTWRNLHKDLWSIYHCCHSPASNAFLILMKLQVGPVFVKVKKLK